MTLEKNIKRLCNRLKKNNQTIAFAESVSGGYISYMFSQAGSGDVFLGGIVSYNAKVKQKILKVHASLIKECTPESMEVTKEMAEGLYAALKPDIAVAITGLCSAGGSESTTKPIGTMFVCILYKGKRTDLHFHVTGNAKEIVHKATVRTVNTLIKITDGL